MVAKNFEVGDLVWAKMKGFPHWPAKIVNPSDESKTPSKKNHHYVYFFGSKNYSWILDENILHHSEEMLQKVSKKKYSGYEEGVKELISESKTTPKKPKSSPKVTNGEIVSPKPKVSSKPKTPKQDSKTVRPKSDEKSTYPVKSKIFVVKSKKRTVTDVDEDSPPLKIPNNVSNDNYSTLFASVLPSIGADVKAITIPNEPKGLQENLVRGFDDLKHVEPTPKKIGFLGLGMMGRSLVRNLLASKHYVTIWNRTSNKCDIFVQAGAIKAYTPADVVKASDITFSCLADPQAVKNVFFGEQGVEKGFGESNRGEKGYVEMSSISAETSQEIAEAVTNAGMKYLEAPIVGSRSKAEGGSICILGSGDRTLFNDCESCFHAMSSHAYYISCDVGKSANINIITSMFLGTMYASLAEVLALTERCQLSQSDIIEILEMRGVSCFSLLEKARSILEKNFVPNTALKHVQKDLNLALKLSDANDQPMSIASAANEVYKHAKSLGCGDFDAAAVYNGTKY